MNSDPEFAGDIVRTAIDKKMTLKSWCENQDTIEVHQAAVKQAQENQSHVVYAYAAMFVVAALFLAFLWMRQQGLKGEIAQLRKDLDAAAKDVK